MSGGVSMPVAIALRAVKIFDQFSKFPTTGNPNKIYIDRANNIQYRWNGTAYVQISSSGTQPLNFIGVYDAQTNTPAISSGSGTTGDFHVVSVANDSISPPIDGITELNIDDQLLAQPAVGGGTEWVRIPALSAVIPPIKISSSQTLTQLNGTYLVDAQTDLTLTIPTTDLTNQSRFIRIVKETGAGTITVVPTAGDSFIGNDQNILMRSIGDVVTVFSSGDITDGWAVIQRSLQDLLVEQIELLKNGNTEPLANENWRIVILANGLMSFQRREADSWVEKQAIGGSVFSDVFIASGVSGGMQYQDDVLNMRREVLRYSPGGTIFSLGDEQLQASIVSNILPLIITNRTDTPTLVNISNQDSTSATTQQMTFSFTSVNGGRIESIVVDTDGIGSARLVVTDTDNNVVVYQSSTDFDFRNNGAGVPVPAGRQTVNLRRVARIRSNVNYQVDIFSLADATYNGIGTAGVDFVPFAQYNLQEVIFDRVGTLSRFLSLTADFTIDSSNVREYRNNSILFTNDTTNATLTITDGVFSDNDELGIYHVPSPDTGTGFITIQAGATGTINGRNTYTLLRETSLNIKHMGGDDWVITDSTSQHPITIRRDTPTVAQMIALTEASVNGNSALWIVANDQLQGQEDLVPDSVLIQALRDDLLDLNGNPIPETTVQKNTLLLEAGTVCRLFSASESESIIRVIMTPQQSTTFIRTLVQTGNLVINDANYTNFRNDVLLFTNPTGVSTVSIANETYSEDDELYIKHFSSSPSMNIGVDLTQVGTGAEIDGQATLQIRNNASARLKYIGDNKWRIISSHGMASNTPTPITPEAHGFSIDIPNRVDVNPSPDVVNTTHTVTYSVTNHSLITSATLYVGTNTFSLTVPTSDGVNIESIAISGIDVTSAQNYNMFVELNGDSNLRSNVQVLRVANLPQSETVHWGFSTTNNPATVDTSTLSTDEVAVAGDTFLTSGTFTTQQWLIILVPSDHDINTIVSTDFPTIDFKSSFTRTDNVRTIGSTNYISYVIQNQGSTGTINYRAEVL